MADQARVGAAERASAGAGVGARPSDLRKRPRPGETLIQALLFLCGVVSILTTLGHRRRARARVAALLRRPAR